MIYFIVGASGTGKSTLFRELKNVYGNSPHKLEQTVRRARQIIEA